MCIPLDILFVCDFCIPSGFCLFNFFAESFFFSSCSYNKYSRDYIHEYLNCGDMVLHPTPIPPFISFYLLKLEKNNYIFY